ncbi:unnamed protein product [Rodentolepis nana]|uniref:Uncharacterized protein n=1 Tax=Rodentolepis nana TaxID=102285 RepID=A0A3P7TAK8_RODNA|nr:unnamed protein product [Rodentolepis nana]
MPWKCSIKIQSFTNSLNALSKSNPLQTGLSQGPQEAVTTCTLFNVLINDIAELVQTVTSMQ